MSKCYPLTEFFGWWSKNWKLSDSKHCTPEVEILGDPEVCTPLKRADPPPPVRRGGVKAKIPPRLGREGGGWGARFRHETEKGKILEGQGPRGGCRPPRQIFDRVTHLEPLQQILHPLRTHRILQHTVTHVEILPSQIFLKKEKERGT